MCIDTHNDLLNGPKVNIKWEKSEKKNAEFIDIYQNVIFSKGCLQKWKKVK